MNLSRSNLQIAMSFLMVVMLMAATGFVGYMHHDEMRRNRDVARLDNNRIELVHQLRAIVRERAVDLNAMMLENDPFVQDYIHMRFLSRAGQFVGLRTQLEQIAADSVDRECAKLLEELRELTNWATPFIEQAAELLQEGKNEEAGKIMRSQVLPAQDKVLEKFEGIIAHYNSMTEKSDRSARQAYQRSFLAMMGLMLAAMMVVVLTSTVVLRRLRLNQADLLQEISGRRQVEEALRKARDHLEQDVAARTAELGASLARLAEAQRIGHMGHWDWDIEHGTLHWSDEVYRIFGLLPQQFGATYEAFLASVHLEDRQAVMDAVNRVLGGEQAYDIVHRVVRPDGGLRIVRESAEITRDSTGKPLRMLGTVQDVTQQQEAENRLRLAARVFENAAEGVVVTDANANILDVNPGFTETTGYLREDLLGQNPRLLQSGRHKREFYEEMWRSLLQEGQWQGEIWDRYKSGEIAPRWLSIVAVKDESGKTINYVGISRDISEAKRAERELWRRAYHDPLCGLPNRDLMFDRLRQAMGYAKRSGRSVVVMLIDLDGFKAVNDRLGHAAGDQLLVEIAKRLKKNVRENDTVARLGGDEFAIILVEMEEIVDIDRVSAKIGAAVSSPVLAGGQEAQVTASTGIAIFPDHGDDAETLLENADSAMYRAKKEGRNTWRFHEQHDHE
ncbi:MAG: diguanylate cyclase [Gammaproteobacteria bacterium]|nr:diguanylate cyclase [Gammaproteobacteria bacterium]MBU1733378.1 diguanylate cyclase [Gammaproteobacteria bacterium]MBU1891795.1 diguanylate cyclase [Gammaproteobacteria bacterium]